MGTGKHYFIEQRNDGTYAIRAKNSKRVGFVVKTQEVAVARIRQLNPEDWPDVERVRNGERGERDKWRSAR